MASLFRPNISTYCLPDGKHRTPEGQRVTKQTPGAIKVTRPSPIWWGRYKAADGTFVKVPLAANKTASKEMLAKLATDAKLAKVGLTDKCEEHHNRPLTQHLADYLRALLAKGDCQEHVDKTGARVRAILDGCKFVFIPDLSASAVAEFLHGLRRDPPRPELPPGQELFTKAEMMAALGDCRPTALARILRREKLSAQGKGKARRYPRPTVEALQDRYCRGLGIATSNGYTLAIKGFTKWLVKDGRTGADPLTALSCLNAKVDVRHGRRALPEAELRILLAAAHCSAVEAEGLAGPDRAWLYAVAMATGFRASELASLTPLSFQLDATPPLAVVRAAYTKNRRVAEQPLPPDLAEALRGYLDGKAPSCPIWPGDWPEQAANMLRVDLDAAGIPYIVEGRNGPLYCDFHGLRHSYITLLAQSGVHPRMAQELARHSDIRLTMERYTHASLYDTGAAVAGLPTLLPNTPRTEANTLQATGTDGPRPTAPRPRLDQTAAPACAGLPTNEHGSMGQDGKDARHKPLILQPVANDCDGLTLGERKLPGQDSNLDKESQNLLCYRYTTGYQKCFFCRNS
jgi:integrase